MTRRVFAAAACTAFLAGSTGSAWQDGPMRPARAETRETAAAERPATRIVGTVWTASNMVVARAHVRLRNLTSGRVDASAVANEAGHFVFAGIDGGPFVVEYVSGDDRVVAVGHAFVVGAGETLVTFIRVGSDKPWYVGFFGNSAAAVVSAAAATGITALAPVQRRASPDRPR